MYEYKYIKEPINMIMFKFSGNVNDNEFNLYKNDLNNILESQKAFYSVFDILDIKNFDINFFIKQVSYMYSKKSLIKKLMKGNVILVDKSYESIVSMTIKLKKQLCPNFITSKKEEGIKFLLLLNS